MKPTQVRVGQRERNRRPSPHVLGKLRVIRSRERPSAPPAPAAGREPERTLGGDVDRLGRKPIEPPGELTIRKDGEADLRIGRTRDGPKAPGMHHFDDMARAFEFGDCDRERPYDAVGLWRPGVGRERDPHAASESCKRCLVGPSCTEAPISRDSSVQRSKAKRPSKTRPPTSRDNPAGGARRLT